MFQLWNPIMAIGIFACTKDWAFSGRAYLIMSAVKLTSSNFVCARKWKLEFKDQRRVW